MDLPNPKELKKLADACRKAGITSFKGGGFEFTLGELPHKAGPKANQFNESDQIESNTLTEQELLFWSTGSFEDPEKAMSEHENR